jgi:hypothetical protein
VREQVGVAALLGLRDKLFQVMICAPAAGRPAFRVGARDRNGREHRENGADDHIRSTKAETVLDVRPGGTVSAAQPQSRSMRLFLDTTTFRLNRAARPMSPDNHHCRCVELAILEKEATPSLFC